VPRPNLVPWHVVPIFSYRTTEMPANDAGFPVYLAGTSIN